MCSTCRVVCYSYRLSQCFSIIIILPREHTVETTIRVDTCFIRVTWFLFTFVYIYEIRGKKEHSIQAGSKNSFARSFLLHHERACAHP